MSPSYSIFAVSAFAYHSLTGLPVLKSSGTHFQQVLSLVQESVTLGGRFAGRLPEEQNYPTYFVGILTMQCIDWENLR